MRKYIALILLLPTAFMIISGAANAQRKNTTAHDVPSKIEADIKNFEKDIKEKTGKYDCKCKEIKHCCKKCKKMHKKHKKETND